MLVQSAGTFQKIQVVNGVFLYRFTSYAGQFIGYGEKPVKVSGRLFIQVFINLKRKKVSLCSSDSLAIPFSKPLNQSVNTIKLIF